MKLNYFAMCLIAWTPLLIAYVWYRPDSLIRRKFGPSVHQVWFNGIGIPKLLVAYLGSLLLTYGFMNLVIHQLGFYELFFTDIMTGSETAKIIVEDFLAKYGDKHRHAGHGLLHGFINAFCFALPVLIWNSFMESKPIKELIFHFSYWLITSMIVCAFISAFV